MCICKPVSPSPPFTTFHHLSPHTHPKISLPSLQQENCVGCDGKGLAEAIAKTLPYGTSYKDRRRMPPQNKFAVPEDRPAPGTKALRIDASGSATPSTSTGTLFSTGVFIHFRAKAWSNDGPTRIADCDASATSLTRATCGTDCPSGP
jgi:hypothetical protein